MAAQGRPVQLACRVLAVSESGYYAQHDRPPSARAIRHAFLTEIIRRVHQDSRGTYGARRVQAELVLGHGVPVGHSAVELLMRGAGIAGVAGRPRFRRIPNVATASDLVERRFRSDEPDRLWVTDITEHPTREGKVYCAVVLDVFSRRGRRLVDRLVADGRPRHQRTRHGDRRTAARRDCHPLRSGHPVHFVGVH